MGCSLVRYSPRPVDDRVEHNTSINHGAYRQAAAAYRASDLRGRYEAMLRFFDWLNEQQDVVI